MRNENWDKLINWKQWRRKVGSNLRVGLIWRARENEFIAAVGRPTGSCVQGAPGVSRVRAHGQANWRWKHLSFWASKESGKICLMYCICILVSAFCKIYLLNSNAFAWKWDWDWHNWRRRVSGTDLITHVSWEFAEQQETTNSGHNVIAERPATVWRIGSILRINSLLRNSPLRSIHTLIGMHQTRHVA